MPIGDFIKQVEATLWKAFIQSAVLVAGVVAAAGAIGLFTAHPLATFLRLLSWAGTAIVVLSVATMLLTFRAASDVQPAARFVSAASAVLCTLASLLMARVTPGWAVLFLAIAVGLVCGALWSRTTLLFVDGARVRARGTAWYLAIWAVTFAAQQALAPLSRHAPAVILAGLVAGAGLTVGNSLGLVMRAARLSARTAAPIRDPGAR